MPDSSVIRIRLLIAGSAVVICLAAVWFVVRPYRQQHSIELPSEISAARYAAAVRVFEDRYRRKPEPVDVLSWLAEQAVAKGDLELAAVCFARIPSDHPQYGRSVRYQAGQVLIRLNRAREAEENLREFIRLEQDVPQPQPDHLKDARQRLRYLLEVELRFEERHELLRKMHENGECDLFDTLKYCFPNLLRWNGAQSAEWLEAFWKQDPGDLDLKIALGRYRTGQGRLDEARLVLDKCCREHPESLHAQAALLALLKEQGDWDRLRTIAGRLPPHHDREPWLLTRIRGHLYNRDGEYAEAASAFRKMLDVDPADAESCIGLGAACLGLNQHEQREQALRRANLLARIQNRLGWALSERMEVQPLAEIVDLCKEAGLSRQALTVAREILKVDPQHRVARQIAEAPGAKSPPAP